MNSHLKSICNLMSKIKLKITDIDFEELLFIEEQFREDIITLLFKTENLRNGSNLMTKMLLILMSLKFLMSVLEENMFGRRKIEKRVRTRICYFMNLLLQNRQTFKKLNFLRRQNYQFRKRIQSFGRQDIFLVLNTSILMQRS